MTSQAGKPYWEVQTDKGRMTAHDEDIAKKLSNIWSSGTFAEVETHTSEDGEWVNIRKFVKEVKVYSPSAVASKVPPTERIGPKPAPAAPVSDRIVIEQTEGIKLMKMNKGYNWEIKLLNLDIEHLEALNNEMVKRFKELS